MTTVEKISMGIIGIGMATTLLLPGRQTVPVIDAVRKLFSGSLATAMNVPRR
ncbi:hypothetical protein ABZ208_37545 [Streptomyces sp. NPDC006208]|uniref:hypothetical protein n=1 Tax=Streptomyces sp. NPDC006208 TaxID=3156734 RepID=UPI0033A7AF95